MPDTREGLDGFIETLDTTPDKRQSSSTFRKLNRGLLTEPGRSAGDHDVAAPKGVGSENHRLIVSAHLSGPTLSDAAAQE